VLGTFAHIDCLLDAVRAAGEAEVEVRDVYSPVPVDGIGELVKARPSRVQYATFVFGLAGVVGGFALAILTSMIWDITVGGKPVTAHVPFVVVGFESLILIGALGTFAALLVMARLPFRGFPGPAYRPEFSKDRFGVWIDCRASEADQVVELLREAGAVAVERLDLVGGKGRGQGGDG
jgi:hypothetical protein